MLTKGEIKYIQSLQDKKHRDAAQRFVVEGAKWLEELIQWQPDWIEKILATKKWKEEHKRAADSFVVESIEDYEMEKISFLSQPSPVLAIARKPVHENPVFDHNRWNLVLDGIQDPGNLGTIIRIADWFGLPAIFCSSDTADAYNPKVVQATMGSLCRVKIIYGNLEKILSETDIPVFISAMQGNNIFDTNAQSGILVIGSEGKGVRPEVAAKASRKITIPRIGRAESLNAAVATGIMLARLTSPRQLSKGH
ncbi:MAG: RNA methyltransferase [Chitinophagaceae bacterium]|nr:RNA methyltransferase [Chitinophagaceae bacterium]MCU0404947.1 RNA methyltransferase [Chitinophagaceae bacterium]